MQNGHSNLIKIKAILILALLMPLIYCGSSTTLITPTPAPLETPQSHTTDQPIDRLDRLNDCEQFLNINSAGNDIIKQIGKSEKFICKFADEDLEDAHSDFQVTAGQETFLLYQVSSNMRDSFDQYVRSNMSMPTFHVGDIGENKVYLLKSTGYSLIDVEAFDLEEKDPLSPVLIELISVIKEMWNRKGYIKPIVQHKKIFYNPEIKSYALPYIYSLQNTDPDSIHTWMGLMLNYMDVCGDITDMELFKAASKDWQRVIDFAKTVSEKPVYFDKLIDEVQTATDAISIVRAKDKAILLRPLIYDRPSLSKDSSKEVSENNRPWFNEDVQAVLFVFLTLAAVGTIGIGAWYATRENKRQSVDTRVELQV